METPTIDVAIDFNSKAVVILTGNRIKTDISRDDWYFKCMLIDLVTVALPFKYLK